MNIHRLLSSEVPPCARQQINRHHREHAFDGTYPRRHVRERTYMTSSRYSGACRSLRMCGSRLATCGGKKTIGCVHARSRWRLKALSRYISSSRRRGNGSSRSSALALEVACFERSVLSCFSRRVAIRCSRMRFSSSYSFSTTRACDSISPRCLLSQKSYVAAFRRAASASALMRAGAVCGRITGCLTRHGSRWDISSPRVTAFDLFCRALRACAASRSIRSTSRK
mmetsp:Transcript_41522/g.109529  ORF Transcript_41522/g.109529 Transcript_41522/m.109529 type:complete len:226 (-) Transcript_41522:570-1247(-)